MLSFFSISQSVLHQPVEPMHFLRTQHSIDIEEYFDLALDLCHSEEVARSGIASVTKVRRIFDVTCRKVQYLRDSIDDDAGMQRDASGFNLNDDDASALGVIDLREAEFKAEIDNGNNLASQVDHALHV